MGGSEEADAFVLYGLGNVGNTSKLNPTLVYLIKNFNLRIGKVRLAEITAPELDKVFRELSQGRYEEEYPQLVTAFNTYVKEANSIYPKKKENLQE